VKLVILIALGALLAFAKRGSLSPRNAIILALTLGFIAAYVGVTWKYGFSLPATTPAEPTAAAIMEG